MDILKKARFTYEREGRKGGRAIWVINTVGEDNTCIYCGYKVTAFNHDAICHINMSHE